MMRKATLACVLLALAAMCSASTTTPSATTTPAATTQPTTPAATTTPPCASTEFRDDTGCRALTQCKADQYEVVAPTPTSDRRCEDLASLWVGDDNVVWIRGQNIKMQYGPMSNSKTTSVKALVDQLATLRTDVDANKADAQNLATALNDLTTLTTPAFKSALTDFIKQEAISLVQSSADFRSVLFAAVRGDIDSYTTESRSAFAGFADAVSGIRTHQQVSSAINQAVGLNVKQGSNDEFADLKSMVEDYLTNRATIQKLDDPTQAPYITKTVAAATYAPISTFADEVRDVVDGAVGPRFSSLSDAAQKIMTSSQVTTAMDNAVKPRFSSVSDAVQAITTSTQVATKVTSSIDGAASPYSSMSSAMSALKSTVSILATTSASLASLAQQTAGKPQLYYETFSGLPNNLGIAGSTRSYTLPTSRGVGMRRWKVLVSSQDSTDYAKTVSGYMQARDHDTSAYWYPLYGVDVSAWSKVTVSAIVRESGSLEDSDYIRGWYKIVSTSSEAAWRTTPGKDSSWTSWFLKRNDFSGWDGVSAVVNIGSGKTLYLAIEAHTTSDSEYVQWDNIQVKGETRRTLAASVGTLAQRCAATNSLMDLQRGYCVKSNDSIHQWPKNE